LLTILRHTNLNMHRRRRPDTTDDVGLLSGARPAFGALPPPTPEDTVITGVLPEHLDLAVRGLDEKFRTAVTLIDLDGLSYAEAAAILDVPVGTVMSRLSRARSRLRAELRPPTAGEGSPQ
jgi:RNA polymerase sigma-70 factor (ECF subfamily)